MKKQVQAKPRKISTMNPLERAFYKSLRNIIRFIEFLMYADEEEREMIGEVIVRITAILFLVFCFNFREIVTYFGWF